MWPTKHKIFTSSRLQKMFTLDYKIDIGRNFYQLCFTVSPVPTTIGALPGTRLVFNKHLVNE